MYSFCSTAKVKQRACVKLPVFFVIREAAQSTNFISTVSSVLLLNATILTVVTELNRYDTEDNGGTNKAYTIFVFQY